MTKLLENKVVVVTGGSRGIGRGISIECARHGADIVISYFSKSDGLVEDGSDIGELLTEIESLGQHVVLVEGNISDPQTSTKIVKAAVDRFGKIDVLVSNAGICPFHSFLDMPHDLYRKVVDVNLDGAFYIVQAVANVMKEQAQGGAIIATSSISALVGGAMQTHYTPTKAGVHSLMQSCAIALGEYNIRCNSVMPGAILTDINREVLSEKETADYYHGRIPLGRIGEPADVAGCVVFLASDLARYVTGASLLVDGGLFVNLQ
jgi:L-rhamnose 1-dehydrogenase